jgi:hypothetical protein
MLTLAVFSLLAEITIKPLLRYPLMSKKMLAFAYSLSCGVVFFSLTDSAFAWIAPWFSVPVYWLMIPFWAVGLLSISTTPGVLGTPMRQRLAPLAISCRAIYLPIPFFAAAFFTPWESVSFALSFCLFLVGCVLLASGFATLLKNSA